MVDQRPRPAAPPLDQARLAALVAPLGREDWVVNLVLVEDHVMADLNARWYGGDGPTDVLSFSYLELEGTARPHLPAGESGAARDLWVAPGEQEAEITAGEVIVAPAFVARALRKKKAGIWRWSGRCSWCTAPCTSWAGSTIRNRRGAPCAGARRTCCAGRASIIPCPPRERRTDGRISGADTHRRDHPAGRGMLPRRHAHGRSLDRLPPPQRPASPRPGRGGPSGAGAAAATCSPRGGSRSPSAAST